MTEQKDPLLEVRGLANQFEGVPLLRDISFSLDQGEILCLLGPSGSGKTTLLRLIAGLEEPDRGSILFAGRDIRPIPTHRRNFGMMFQEYALFPHKSVFGNIAFGLEMLRLPSSERAEKVRQVLHLVGLDGFENRKIDDLSGGERQRVALARSLAPEPRLLLLDEPLGSLDRTLRDRLAEEIRSILKSFGVTAVFVTHDQAEAFSVADKVAVLQEGVLHRFDTPENIYRNPGNRCVAQFLGFTNFISTSENDDGILHSLFNNLAAHDITIGPDRPSSLLIRSDGARLLTPESFSDDQPCITGIVVDKRFQGSTYKVSIKVGRIPLTFNLPIDPRPPDVDQPIRLRLISSALIMINDESHPNILK